MDRSLYFFLKRSVLYDKDNFCDNSNLVLIFISYVFRMLFFSIGVLYK